MSTTGKKNIKNANIGRLNNTHMNNLQAREDIKEEIKICIETNENTKQKPKWDSVKTVPRRRFIAIQVYLKKQEKHQIP